MTNIRWDLLKPADVGGAVWQGYERGRAMRERHDLQKAMARLSDNPDDPDARRVVSALSPQSLYALEDASYQRGERKRASEFRGAHADYLLERERGAGALDGSGATNYMGGPSALSGTPAPGALSAFQPRPGGGPVNALLQGPGQAFPSAPPPQTNALSAFSAPQTAPGAGMYMGATPPAPGGMPSTAPADPAPQARRPAYERTAAWRRMVQADPSAAQQARSNLAKLTKEELDAADATNDQSLEMLATVYDQGSYDSAKQRARAMYQQYGQDPALIDTLPAEYSPDIIHTLRTQAMETKDLLTAVRQEKRLDWDIEDDELDNDRAERSLRSMERYRQGSLRDRQTRTNRMGNRPGGSRPGPAPSKSATIGRLLEKKASGKPLTPAEEQVLSEHGGGRENYPNGTVIEMPDGTMKERKNGRWVAVDG